MCVYIQGSFCFDSDTAVVMFLNARDAHARDAHARCVERALCTYYLMTRALGTNKPKQHAKFCWTTYKQTQVRTKQTQRRTSWVRLKHDWMCTFGLRSETQFFDKGERSTSVVSIGGE